MHKPLLSLTFTREYKLYFYVHLILLFLLVMNPISKFKSFIIGDALLSTEDPFQQVKVQVLFNFTLFFLVLNIPYSIVSYLQSTFHFLLAMSSSLALATVFVILKKVKNIKWAVYFYIINHLIQNFIHFIINNGIIELQGILFFLLIILFGFLLVDKVFGFSLLLFVLVMYFIGTYNTQSGHALFSVPDSYGDPTNEQVRTYFTVIPLLLNAFLISQFVGAKQKAEQKIKEQKVQLELAYEEMTIQKHDIISSINYAQKIQLAVLPALETVSRNIPQSFILYKPKDIVSGDFYWYSKQGHESFIVVADCTGHGVPGAFLSMVGSTLLNEIIIHKKIHDPALIINSLATGLSGTLANKEKDELNTDGMDISICKIDHITRKLYFAGANQSIFIVDNYNTKEIKPQISSINGIFAIDKTEKITSVEIDLRDGIMVYMSTDGYVDQIGEETQKKYLTSRYEKLLGQIHTLSVEKQKYMLEETFDEWKGDSKQIDDVLIIGFKI